MIALYVPPGKIIKPDMVILNRYYKLNFTIKLALALYCEHRVGHYELILGGFIN